MAWNAYLASWDAGVWGPKPTSQNGGWPSYSNGYNAADGDDIPNLGTRDEMPFHDVVNGIRQGNYDRMQFFRSVMSAEPFVQRPPMPTSKPRLPKPPSATSSKALVKNRKHEAEAMFGKTKMCKFFLRGTCTRGKGCTFAHTEDEMQAAPDLFRTQLCHKERKPGGQCSDPDCRFAHHASELRYVEASDGNPTDDPQSGLPNDFPGQVQAQNEASGGYSEDVNESGSKIKAFLGIYGLPSEKDDESEPKDLANSDSGHDDSDRSTSAPASDAPRASPSDWLNGLA